MMASKKSVLTACFYLVLGFALGTILIPILRSPLPKPFGHLNLVVFAGGESNDIFSRTITKGAMDAAAFLGPNIHIVWSGWQPDKMVTQFADLMAKRPNGIAIMGHPGDQKLKPLVDEAFRKDIVVTSLNTPLPDLQKMYKHQGFGYVGSNIYKSGALLAGQAVKLFNISPGSRALVFGFKNVSTRGQRTEAMIKTLSNHQIQVDFAQLPIPMSKLSPEQLTDYIRHHLGDGKLPELIMADNPYMTNAIGTIIKELGYSLDHTYIAGVDLTLGALVAMEAGLLDLTVDQQPYLQGFLSVVQLCLSIEYGFSGLEVYTDTALVDEHNMERLKPLVQRHIR